MLFYNYQFGFIKNNSTNHALIEIAEYEMLVTKNLFTCGVYVDLQKALDTVNHEMFLSKLCIIFKNSISQCTTRVCTWTCLIYQHQQHAQFRWIL